MNSHHITRCSTDTWILDLQIHRNTFAEILEVKFLTLKILEKIIIDVPGRLRPTMSIIHANECAIGARIEEAERP